MMEWLRRHGWRMIVLPLAIYTITAMFVTWPLSTQLRTHLAGPAYTDSYEFARLGWWGGYALAHGLNPFYQSLFGYPAGFTDAMQIAQPLIYWPITLLNFVVGKVAAFNVWLLIEVILSGWAAFGLAWDVVGHLRADGDSSGGQREARWLAAVVGGLIFMVFPTVQGHLTAGHVNLLSNYASPVVVLCLYRIVTGRGGWRIAVIGAVALLIVMLGSFTYPVYVLLPLILFGGVYLSIARRREVWRWSVLRELALMLIGGAVLSLPFYLPLIRDLTVADRPAYLQEGGWVTYSTDLLAFVSPSPFAWLKPIVPTYTRAVLGTNSIEGAAYLGIVAVVLAMIAVWRWREARLWLVIVLGCMLFSLGPILKVGDQPVRYQLGDQTTGQIESNVVMPYALIQHLPLINVTRTPGRFNVLTGLALGVLAAIGLWTLLERVPPRRWVVRGGCAVLAVLILLEYQMFFPYPTTEASVPNYFRVLAERNDGRAVFDVPIDDPLAQKVALWQQTTHQQPLVAGYVSRRSSVDPAKLGLLSKLVTGELSQTDLTATQVKAILRAQGIGTVVYHRDLLDARWDTVMSWATQVFGTAVHQAERIAIYEVPQEADIEQANLIAPSAEFYTSAQNNIVWLKEAGDLYVYAAEDIDQRISVKLSPLFKSRRLQLFVDGAMTRAWMIDVPQEELVFWVKLTAGFHTLRLVTPDGCVEVPITPICLMEGAAREQCGLLDAPICVSMGVVEVSTAPEREMAYQEMPVQLQYGLSLRGVRVPKTAEAAERIIVDTEWSASEQLPGDYHFFIHVVDSNGTLITQYDSVPGESTFPTTQWSAQQAWSQTATIDLPMTMTAGTYDLYAGWYRYPELSRLTVEGARKGAGSQLVFIGSLVIP